MSRKKKLKGDVPVAQAVEKSASPANPLHCGCGVKGFRRLDHGDAEERFERLHISFCPMHAAAPELLKACKVVDNFLNAMEAGTSLSDPLREVRLRIHAPLRAALTPAIAKAESTAHPETPAPSSQHQTTKKRGA